MAIKLQKSAQIFGKELKESCSVEQFNRFAIQHGHIYNTLKFGKYRKCFNYHYFAKIRGIKPKDVKLTNMAQFYPAPESTEVQQLLFNGFRDQAAL